ncbi:MAG TPA: NAD(P)H-binding protein [Solirubrobacterales bacterium]
MSDRLHGILGATGYIGERLALELRERREPVRALARIPERAHRLAAAGAEVRRADVLEREGLDEALEGVSVLYYLVHSMGRGSAGDFAEGDARGARNAAEAARRAGVELIVYLGGLSDGGSKHLESRHDTASALASAGVPVTYARAATVLGAGSESFRIVAHLVRRLPLMITPRWVSVRTQPIGIDDVVRYLADVPDVRAAWGRELELGGADVTTYGGLMDIAAEAMGMRSRRRLAVPLLTPRLSSLWVGLITPVDPGVARPLIEGLGTETVVRDPSGMGLFDFEPADARTAMRAAVREFEGRA